MSYADKRGVKVVVMIGEEEIQQDKLTVKNMCNGKQESISFTQLIKNITVG